MKKYVGYVRVSTAKQGQHGSSLQEQRDAILAFSKRHNLTVVEWFEDRETAAKKGRTQFLKMMTILEKGRAHGVILHKIDRGARNLWDWARLQDLIDVGVEVHFAHDNLDLRSRGGRLAADIQAVVAADYVRNLRDEVRKGIRGRLKQGFYPFKAPVGYLDRGKAKPKTIDPIKGPLVREAFELYATKRYSYHTLALELHRRGLRASSGKPPALHTITRILRNPFYIGIIRIEKTNEVFQGVHEPLVEARIFQRVQDIIDGRENVYSVRHSFAFRRLLTCGLCKYALTGERQKGHVYYRCHTRTCPTSGIREDEVAAIFKGIVDSIPFSPGDLREMMPYVEQEERSFEKRQADALAALKLRIAAIQDREHRLTDAFVDNAIDRDSYNDRRAALLTELAQARDELKRVEAGCGTISERVGKFFELLRMAQLGPGLESEQEFREVVQIMTSNRSLTGKELVIEPRSPFKEIIFDTEMLFGGPSRNGLRTFDADGDVAANDNIRRDRQSALRRFRTLSSCLEGWEGCTFARAGNRNRKRQRNPGWFGPKHGTAANGDLREAA